jgi:hypothetical protein
MFILVNLAALSPGVRQLGHKADNSCLSHAEIKNEWSNTSTRPLAFIMCRIRTSPLAYKIMFLALYLYVNAVTEIVCQGPYELV